ncbi:MAG: hypothetical protein ACHRXM_21460 [Isosphaerales bacterium]
MDAEKIESILKGSTSWLTPKAIEGYDANDFCFLSDEERTQLTESVEQFRAIASAAPNQQPATKEQFRAAVPKFRRILEIIRPDKYADLDAFRIGKQIEQQVAGKLPEWVREMVFETGSDVNGAPALWIWVEVEDNAAWFGRTGTKNDDLERMGA